MTTGRINQVTILSVQSDSELTAPDCPGNHDG